MAAMYQVEFTHEQSWGKHTSIVRDSMIIHAADSKNMTAKAHRAATLNAKNRAKARLRKKATRWRRPCRFWPRKA